MAIVLATGGTIYGGTRWYLNSHTSMAGYDKTSKTIEVQVQKGNLTLGTTVSGTTEAGLAYQNFLLTFLEQNGYLPVVEEVYVAAGDSVEKGTALYKITEESISGSGCIKRRCIIYSNRRKYNRSQKYFKRADSKCRIGIKRSRI